MDILRIITILLGSLEPESKDNDKYEVYYRLQGILGPGLLYWYHYANFGIKIKTETHEDDCIAVNFLKLYHRTDDIDPLHIKIMNIILVIASENTHNSSTSAARLTISTKSDLHSCIVSGMNTFKGPLHGGAVERSIKFLLSLKSIEHSN